jgi:hypothetical protein
MRLVCCQSCALIFNSIFDSGLVDYDGNYDNALDFSQSFQDYSRALANRLIQTYGLQKKHVVEIGSGNGRFLWLLCEGGANEGIGFDPTCNGGCGPAGQGSLTFVGDLFRGDFLGRHPAFICFRHVLEHIGNPAGFLQDLHRSLSGGSGAIIYCEVPNASCILGGSSIWEIIYQHVSYFTAAALKRLFESNGFRTLEIGTAYEGQFLYIEASPCSGPTSFCGVEADTTAALAADFGRRFTAAVAVWRQFLEEACREGRRLALWGCGAKGVTFLNLVPGADCIQFVVDVNPHKQGTYVPGTGQRILNPSDLKESRPDTIVIPNPIYKHEVERSLAEFGIMAEVIPAAATWTAIEA